MQESSELQTSEARQARKRGSPATSKGTTAAQKSPRAPRSRRAEPPSPFPAAERQGRAEPGGGTAPRGARSGQGSATLRWPAPRRGSCGEPRPAEGRHLPGAAMVRGRQGRGRSPSLTPAAQQRGASPRGRSLAPGTAQDTGHGTGHRTQSTGHGTRLLPAPPPARGAPCRAGLGAAPARHSAGLVPEQGHGLFQPAAITHCVGGRGNSATTRRSCVTVVSRNLEPYSWKRTTDTCFMLIPNLGFVVSSMSKENSYGEATLFPTEWSLCFHLWRCCLSNEIYQFLKDCARAWVETITAEGHCYCSESRTQLTDFVTEDKVTDSV